jgi:pimeloyl-ACP methyl ester carboxylesterase
VDRRQFLVAGSVAAALDASGTALAQQGAAGPARDTAYTATSRTAMDPAGVTRHMVTIGRRQVHFRRSGTGPPVLMLHPSPSTSRMFISYMSRFKDRFTLFALDTPGNGISDALDTDAADISLYSRNVVQVMDALGLEQCTLLGGYTGGIITLDASQRFPERIPSALVHGYLQLTEEERRDFLANYLLPVTPDVFGSYLVAQWAHFRDGGLFFPWHRQDIEHRRIAGVPSAAAINRSVIDVLRAGDVLRRPYRSALATDTGATLRRVRNRLVVTMSPEDEMWPHRLRMPPLQGNVSFVPGTSTADCLDIWDRTLVANKVSATPPAPKPAAPIPGAIWGDMIPIDGSIVYVRRSADGRGRPLLFLHDTDGSSRSCERWMQPFIGRRPVLAPDLPGRGESDAAEGADLGVAAQANFIARLLARERVDSVDIVAFGFGAVVATELALRHERLVNRLVLADTRFPAPDDVAAHTTRYAPEVALDPYGAHLTTVWNQVRDQQLFEPWFRQEARTVVQGRKLDLAPALLDIRVVEVLKCLPRRTRLFADVFAYPLYERIAALRQPLLAVLPGREFAAVVAARVGSHALAEPTVGEPAEFARRVEAFLGRNAV